MPVCPIDREADVRRIATSRVAAGERGQAMLEFAFVLPVLMLVVVGMIEFALAFNATLGVNRASQDAALVAVRGRQPAGRRLHDPCARIERTSTAPSDKSEITGVEIQRTNPSGTTVFTQQHATSGAAR